MEEQLLTELEIFVTTPSRFPQSEDYLYKL